MFFNFVLIFLVVQCFILCNANFPNVYSKNESSVSFRIENADAMLSIRYYFEINMYILKTREIKKVVHPQKCVMWPSYCCFTISNLVANKKFEFYYILHQTGTKGQAAQSLHTEKQFLTAFGEDFNLTRTVTTKEEKSLPVENLRLHDYTLLWEHPNVTNGVLKQFSIKIGGENDEIEEILEECVIKSEHDYNKTYSYHVRIMAELAPSTEYTITVVPFNNIAGEEAQLVDYTGPPKLTLKNDKFKINVEYNTGVIKVETPNLDILAHRETAFCIIEIFDKISGNLTVQKQVNLLQFRENETTIINTFLQNSENYLNCYLCTATLTTQFFAKFTKTTYKREFCLAGDYPNTEKPSISFDKSSDNIITVEKATNQSVTIVIQRPIFYLFHNLTEAYIIFYNQKLEEDSLTNPVWEINLNMINLTYEVDVGNGTQIYSNLLKKDLQNKILESNTCYNLTADVVAILGEENRSFDQISSTICTAANIGDIQSAIVTYSLVGIFVFIIIVAILLYLGFREYKRRRNLKYLGLNVQSIDSTNMKEDAEDLYLNLLALNDNSFDANTHTHKVSKKEFGDYLKQHLLGNKKDNVVLKQFSSLPRGKIKKCHFAMKAENLKKNADKKYVPYDDNKVELSELGSLGNDTYINASYIESYNPKTYIACTGPKFSTIKDFWRMIWQEEVKIVIMASCINEGGKRQCAEYWPPLNSIYECEDMVIKNVKTTTYQQFLIRNMDIFYMNQSRSLQQYHLLWTPDNGIPMYPDDLVPLLLKLRSVSREKTPIVVHCGNGSDRTGIIILCDMALEMAERENHIDMYNIIAKLRSQRTEMVSELKDFILSHFIVAECMLENKFSVAVDTNFKTNINLLKESKNINNLYNTLLKLGRHDKVLQPISKKFELNDDNKLKNRFADIIPEGGSETVKLSDEAYINAVRIDGFQNVGQFIVTQQPLPETLHDFWKMILETKINVIVSLNSINLMDKTSCNFWPRKSVGEELRITPVLSIVHLSEESSNGYVLAKVLLQCKEGKQVLYKRTITIVHTEDWSNKDKLPPSNQLLINIWKDFSALYSKDVPPTLVTCYDGATASGLFVALWVLLDKMTHEQECDVCLAVRKVRRNRKHFLRHQAQLKYLYEASLEYYNNFDYYTTLT